MAMDAHAQDHMHQIIPNLWLGDLSSALDTDALRQQNIRSILTAMRGRTTISEIFNRLQVDLNDTDDEDILQHLTTCITFIQSELDKERGVLVHCVAGISRSASIIAAFLMYSQGLTYEQALGRIRETRPIAEPNVNFASQLALFQRAACHVSRQDKAIRMFYLERMVRDIRGGKVTNINDLRKELSLEPNMGDSTSNRGVIQRRKIRCKMCRQELATADNMIDHGQLGPPTPAVSYSPTISSPQSSDYVVRASGAQYNDAALSGSPSIIASSLERQVDLGLTLSNQISVDQTQIQGPKSPGGPRQSSFPESSSDTSMSQLSSGLAALRTGLGLSIVTAPSLSSPRQDISPSLANLRCSGYFVEPLKWMDRFLEQGLTSGKILCPNTKCNAKLGNYDWAGVCCSCKEWVVPGFCIHRSKVDEVS